MGRATKLTEAATTAYLDALRRGLTKLEAAAHAGLGAWIFKRTEAADKAFAREVAAAVRSGKRARRRASEAAKKAELRIDRDLQRRVDKALEGLVTYADAARRLGVTREAVRQMARAGTIPVVRTPAGPLVLVPKKKGRAA